jgi:hypothetical protein
VGLLAAVLVLAVGSGASSAQSPEAGSGTTASEQALTLDATDYAFAWPETIDAGLVSVTLANSGQDLHHAYLVRLDEGATADQLMPVMDRLLGEDPAAFAEFEELVSWSGGIGILMPGASQTLTLDLGPGEYVWFCGIPAPDGQPHYAKGMVSSFEVRAATEDGAVVAPQATGEVGLQDFAFALPESIGAGEQRWEVTNAGSQTHEMLLARLEPGATAIDFAMAFGDPAATEPPPGVPLGGVGPIEPGTATWLDLDLEPGTYAAFCYIPDPGSGQPHLALGMIAEFTVDGAAT